MQEETGMLGKDEQIQANYNASITLVRTNLQISPPLVNQDRSVTVRAQNQTTSMVPAPESQRKMIGIGFRNSIPRSGTVTESAEILGHGGRNLQDVLGVIITGVETVRKKLL